MRFQIYICIYYKNENENKKSQPCVLKSICSITETNIIEIGKRIKALRRKSKFSKVNFLKLFSKNLHEQKFLRITFYTT